MLAVYQDHPADAEPRPREATTYHFGAFRLDAPRRLVHRGTETIRLPERLFRILLLLVQADGGVVTREKIASEVWSNRFVSIGSLNQHMYMLRQLLRERARDRALIVTINGAGYKLTTPVATEPGPVAATGSRTEEDLLGSGLDAYDAHCQGFQLLESRTGAALIQAIDQFETAISQAPGYAPALIGLARCYVDLGKFWHFPSSSAFRKAKSAASRVLAIEPASAMGHAINSSILLFGYWEWLAARSELESALRRTPSCAYIHEIAAWYHVCTGAYDEALADAQRAVMLEPSSLWLRLVLGLVLIHSGDYAKGIKCLSQVVDADAALPIARRFRAQAFLLSGYPDKALTDLIFLSQDRIESPLICLPLLARTYADCGDMVRAQGIYAALLDKSKTEFVSSCSLAIVAVAIKRNEEAVAHLERAFANREPQMLLLEGLPWFERIAHLPRFKNVMRSVRHALITN
jgi:DNA-binding winged helix-turn-helix (wHTH) protein